MINYLQLNQNVTVWENNIITNDIWENIFQLQKQSPSDIAQYIHEISIQYNTDKKTVIKNYFNYIIRSKPECINVGFLKRVEQIMHAKDANMEHILRCLS